MEIENPLAVLLFELPIPVLTSALAYFVGIFVLVKGNATTHALTELFILVVFVAFPRIKKKQDGTENKGTEEEEAKSDPDESQSRIKRIEKRRRINIGFFFATRTFANLLLLIMLALEAFGVSIPDSKKANLGLAILNITYGSLGGYTLILWFNQYTYEYSGKKDREKAEEILVEDGNLDIVV